MEIMIQLVYKTYVRRAEIIMYTNELVVKLVSKISIEIPETDQLRLRDIVQELLYDYDIQPACRAIVPRNNMLDMLGVYLASQKIDGRSDKTLKNYARGIMRFSSCVLKNVADVTDMDIRIYLANRMRNNNLKNSTIEEEKSVLRSFFNWLENQDYIHKSPMRKVKPTKVEQRMRQALEDDELELLRDNCKTLRQRALLEFLYSTGCRLDETVNVDISDVDWATNSLRVIGKGNKEREVLFSKKARYYMKKYIKTRYTRDSALFVSQKKPYGRLMHRAIQKEVKNIAIQAGFTKPLFPHLFRHSFATAALNSGIPLPVVQELLGHSDVSTTQVYAKLNKSTARAEYAKHFN
jgi:integrase/recombinase XerD